MVSNKTNMTLPTKPCHFLNLNKSKSASSYSKADRFYTLFHLLITKFDSGKLQLKECNYPAPLQPT